MSARNKRKRMIWGSAAVAVWMASIIAGLMVVVIAAVVFNSVNEREMGTIPGTGLVVRLPTQDPIEVAIRRASDQWPNDYRRVFLRKLAAPAIDSGAEYCLPPSVTLAQAALESGWGRSQAAVRFNNLFGLKAADDTSAILLTTDEVVAGRRITITARFMTFPDWGAALHEHDRRISTLGAYRRARAVRDQGWQTYIRALAPIYATDPSYVRNVTRLIDTYGLDAFDAIALSRARERGACVTSE